ncbi:MAG: FtsX-like permease family protein [Blautia sp.]|nr:FtsX-like permease family protein [Blautia sp.]
MDILVLLKANIRKKKGTFLCIVLLTVIIVALMLAALSVRENFDRAVERAYAATDSGDIAAFIKEHALTDSLRESVENHELVERVKYLDAICADSARVGDKRDGNGWYLMELREGIFLYNEKLDGFQEEIPELKEGEIYLPLGIKSKMGCAEGDTLTLQCLDGEHSFCIRGFVQEPVTGSENMGWKQVFISGEDFNKILENCGDQKDEAGMQLMLIYKAKDCGLSDMKFQRQLNLDTKIIAKAHGSLTKQQSVNYTGLLQNMFAYVLLVFGGFLFVIVLIVMSHSISSELETDYVNLGILKSQGFTRGRIRVVLALQYLLAEFLGIVAGCILAYPLERGFCLTMIGNTGILPVSGVSVPKSAAVVGVIIVFTVVMIYLRTGKIGKISPIRAIAGGREEIWFDSRIHLPVSKRLLTLSLSFRQFTSSKKRYVGTIFIAAILMFFLLSAQLIGNLMTSRNALSAMGMDIGDVEVVWKDETQKGERAKEIEDFADSVTEVEKKYFASVVYMSVNGENLRGSCYQYPEYIHPILKGRAPLYDNEIVITEMVADALETGMGDEVTVAYRDEEVHYLVSGIYQSGSDSGMTFALSMEGAKRLGIDHVSYMDFSLADPSESEALASAIEKEFGDLVEAETFTLNVYLGDSVQQGVLAIQILIYGLSVLFILLVVRMVCAKNFVQERTDIGIYKAIGFTVGKLRLQFALRFLVVALIGAALGTILSVLFSAPLLGAFLSMIGLSTVSTEYTAATILLPVAVMGICFFVFAWLSARRVKKVEVRELIVE